MNRRLLNYASFLEKLSLEIEHYFQQQQDFIVCKKGCSYCCKSGNYPVSDIEFQFIELGVMQLDRGRKKAIKKRVERIGKAYRKYQQLAEPKVPFRYHCPFLFENACTIYQYRPIICRTYGLIISDENSPENMQLPSCLKEGLNYANIWDPNIGRLSYDKINSLGIDSEPQAYDINYGSLLYKFDHGEIQMIYKWILEKF